MKNITTIWGLLLVVSLFLFSCSDTEEMSVAAPTSNDLSFTYTVDPENPNLIHFIGETSVETWYTHWNFGDNTGDEGLEASKVFFNQGTYEVRFKIFTDGGTASITETIEIESDFEGPDLIENGSFDNEDNWTAFSISPGAEVELRDGEAVWSGGGWGNVGIYQQIEIEANKEYEISMDVSGSGMSDCWFEIYIGTLQPQDGVDYSDGGIQIGLNTWEGCGSEAFSGQLTDIACVGEAKFTWPMAGIAYFVIKSGGADLGTEGVTVDNIAIRSF